LRARLTPGSQLTAGSLGLACVALVLGFVHVAAVAAVALAAGGLAWILALSTLNSLYQLSLPRWVTARGMAFYLVVFQGGNAVGSAVVGIAAQHFGLSPTLLAAAAGLALGPLAGLRYRFRPIRPEELVPAVDWPQPRLTGDGTPDGPVMVSVEYLAAPGRDADLWPRCGTRGSAGAAPERVPGEHGRTAPSRDGSSSSSWSPPGPNTSASMSASQRATRNGTRRSGR
jgi:hypothetical protein